MGKAARSTVALIVVALLAVVACTTGGKSADTAVGEPAARSEKVTSSGGTTGADAPQWLFAAQSQGDSTFDASTGRLSMPTDSVQGFTDRPYRDSRVVTPQAFANLFHQGGHNSFTKDPPNAVLTYWDTSTGTPTPRSAVCEASRGAGVSDGRLWVGLKVLEPAGSTLPSKLARASLFVDDVPLSGCPTSPDDETIVEYFNQIEFSQDITLTVQDMGDTYQLSLNCPPQQNPYFPPPNLVISLTPTNDSTQVTCNTGVINIVTIQIPQLEYCTGPNVCAFDVTATNRATGAVYSTTELQVTFTGDTTFSPSLNPAVLPVCPNNFNPCMLSGDCSLSTPKVGQLELCDSSASCTTPG